MVWLIGWCKGRREAVGGQSWRARKRSRWDGIEVVGMEEVGT